MIVDAHNHLVWPNEPDLEPDILDPRVLLESGVIERAWLLSTGHSIAHSLPDQNDDVLALAKKHPGFFIPFAYLDAEAPPESIDRFHDRGFAGLKAIFPPFPYDDDRFLPHYEKAERHGMPIVFHAGGAPYWSPKLLGVPMTHLASKNMFVQTLDLVAKLFPKLPIIIAHMGGPHSYEFSLFMARGHPNVYLDLSCSPIEREWLGKMQEVIDVVKADKILFGSDSRDKGPIKKALFWKYYFETRRWANPGDKEKILGLNAERILAESGFDPNRIR